MIRFDQMGEQTPTGTTNTEGPGASVHGVQMNKDKTLVVHAPSEPTPTTHTVGPGAEMHSVAMGQPGRQMTLQDDRPIVMAKKTPLKRATRADG